MPLFCLDPGTDFKKHKSRLDKLKGLFNGEVFVPEGKDDWFGRHLSKKDDIGDKITTQYGDVRDPMGGKMFSKIVWRATNKPASEDFTNFTKGDYRRIANEIQRESRQLSKGGMSPLEKLLFVKRGTMRKYAITRWLNDKILDSANYERTAYSKFMDNSNFVSQILRQEAVKRKAQPVMHFGIEAGQKLDLLERKMSEIKSDIYEGKIKGDKVKDLEAELRTAQDEMVDVLYNEGGKVLQEFIAWMETPEPAAGEKKMMPESLGGGEFSSNIRRAGIASRRLLNDMGDVLINGLNKHMDLMEDLYLNGGKASKMTTPMAMKMRKFRTRITKEVKAIEKGMEEGKYFPHFVLEGFGKINDMMEKIDAKTTHEELIRDAPNDLAKVEAILSEIKSGLNAVPAASKHRRSKGYENWMRNPLAVLRRYSMDAISFNKHQHIRHAYSRVIRQMPKDSEITQGLRDYLEDIYTLSTKGWKDRSPWVNKTVRVLTGFEFLSKLGFAVGAGARNMLSGMYFVEGVGNKAFFDYMSKWNSDRYAHIREAAEKLEKKEAGFRFEDVSYDLYQEGLLPTKGVITKDVDIKIGADGKPRLEYDAGDGWQKFDTAFAYATGKAAVIQRITENVLRKHMWRASFFIKYRELEEGGLSNIAATTSAKRFALDMVNKYAFEYAAHQKAPITGGTPGDLGAVGQVAFQFFHFPFSFLQMQSEVLRNSKDAAIAGQWNHPDTYVPLRFAGLYMFTRLASGVTNIDFHNLMENDTIERVRDLVDVVGGKKEDIKGRGYLGPAVGDLFFLASLFELVDMPDNQFVDLIVGYNNAYKLTDAQKQSRLLSTLNVEVSKILTRDIPSLKSGDGLQVLRHELGLYPRAWTREMHEKIWGKPKRKRGKKSPQELASEKQRKQEIEMRKLYRAMGV